MTPDTLKLAKEMAWLYRNGLHGRMKSMSTAAIYWTYWLTWIALAEYVQEKEKK